MLPDGAGLDHSAEHRTIRLSATPETVCASCGAGLPTGARFCMQCGTPAASTCPACGQPIVPGARFCMQCGTRVDGEAMTGVAADPSSAGAGPTGTISERRLVSVLFADLVGFTTLSEHRDPEEVRELLSQYFDRCRTIIERYGGTVEKFIGDAVMAVWGTPVAREDDAERAVRAALALTAAVTALGEEVGMPELRVRAGVLTGSAAVEVGAEGEGMVLGDTVNTASRLQSIAAPGTVLVDDVTRRASEAAIAYEDAGNHQVKGREQPVHAWTALRVVAGAGGARRERRAGGAVRRPRPRAAGDHRRRRAQRRSEARAELVAVVGEAGPGKSRLLWEFFKYLDGIQEIRWWHAGPLPVLRRGGGLLGAGRDGSRASPDRRGGPASGGPREAAGRGRGARHGRARAPARRAAPGPSAAAGGAPGGRSGRSVQRLATVLGGLAHQQPRDPRLRGSAVGGQRPAGVHRLSARVVSRVPDLS